MGEGSSSGGPKKRVDLTAKEVFLIEKTAKQLHHLGMSVDFDGFDDMLCGFFDYHNNKKSNLEEIELFIDAGGWNHLLGLLANEENIEIDEEDIDTADEFIDACKRYKLDFAKKNISWYGNNTEFLGDEDSMRAWKEDILKGARKLFSIRDNFLKKHNPTALHSFSHGMRYFYEIDGMEFHGPLVKKKQNKEDIAVPYTGDGIEVRFNDEIRDRIISEYTALDEWVFPVFSKLTPFDYKGWAEEKREREWEMKELVEAGEYEYSGKGNSDEEEDCDEW